LGFLFAAFMLGLFVGGRIGTNFKTWLLCLCCAGWAAIASQYPAAHLPVGAAGGTAVFCAWLFVAGVISGAIYSSVARDGQNGAPIYSADLWGACAGAIVPAIIAPMWSIKIALAAAAIPALLAGAFLLRKR